MHAQDFPRHTELYSCLKQCGSLLGIPRGQCRGEDSCDKESKLQESAFLEVFHEFQCKLEEASENGNDEEWMRWDEKADEQVKSDASELFLMLIIAYPRLDGDDVLEFTVNRTVFEAAQLLSAVLEKVWTEDMFALVLKQMLNVGSANTVFSTTYDEENNVEEFAVDVMGRESKYDVSIKQKTNKYGTHSFRYYSSIFRLNVLATARNIINKLTIEPTSSVMDMYLELSYNTLKSARNFHQAATYSKELAPILDVSVQRLHVHAAFLLRKQNITTDTTARLFDILCSMKVASTFAFYYEDETHCVLARRNQSVLHMLELLLGDSSLYLREDYFEALLRFAINANALRDHSQRSDSLLLLLKHIWTTELNLQSKNGIVKRLTSAYSQMVAPIKRENSSRELLGFIFHQESNIFQIDPEKQGCEDSIELELNV
mmetsp:Transcript_11060/g.20523  ORF Transcript_11060/g.20523 Transcript_11060/m.20523 type:complete len:431 (+) Transcript_11060:1046-2338(+)